MFTTICSVLIGIFGVFNGFAKCSSVRLRLSYNVLIFGSWLLYIVLGVILLRIAQKVPAELDAFI